MHDLIKANNEIKLAVKIQEAVKASREWNSNRNSEAEYSIKILLISFK